MSKLGFLKSVFGLGKKKTNEPTKLPDGKLQPGEKVYEYDPIRKRTCVAESISTKHLATKGSEAITNKEIQQKENHFYVVSVNLKSAIKFFERHHDKFYALIKSPSIHS